MRKSASLQESEVGAMSKVADWTRTWSRISSALSVSSVAVAYEFLEEAQWEVLRSLGCPETDPINAGNWCAQVLRDSGETSLSDTEISMLRGQFPVDVRMNPAVIDVAEEIFDSDLLRSLFGLNFRYLHMPPMARFVLPGNGGAGVPPHFDWQYNTHMSDFANVWVPAVPITDECGGVTVWELSDEETSQTENTSVHDTSSGIVREWHDAIETEGLVSQDCVPMDPGDVLVFGTQVIHGSMANTSSRTRISMEFRWLPEGGHSTRPVLDLKNGLWKPQLDMEVSP